MDVVVRPVRAGARAANRHRGVLFGVFVPDARGRPTPSRGGLG
jgi:hypothetical protein